MDFLKLDKNPSPLIDTVFTIVEKAKIAKEKYGSENVIDATIGSLCDEEGVLVAFDTLYNNFKNIVYSSRTSSKSIYCINANIF